MGINGILYVNIQVKFKYTFKDPNTSSPLII